MPSAIHSLSPPWSLSHFEPLGGFQKNHRPQPTDSVDVMG